MIPDKIVRNEINSLKEQLQQAARDRADEQARLDQSMQQLRKMLSFDDKIMEIFKSRDR